jgi:hypothetical protein
LGTFGDVTLIRKPDTLLVCDLLRSPDCQEILEIPIPDDVDEVVWADERIRSWAARFRGWGHIDGLDVCPECSISS